MTLLGIVPAMYIYIRGVCFYINAKDPRSVNRASRIMYGQ